MEHSSQQQQNSYSLHICIQYRQDRPYPGTKKSELKNYNDLKSYRVYSLNIMYQTKINKITTIVKSLNTSKLSNTHLNNACIKEESQGNKDILK